MRGLVHVILGNPVADTVEDVAGRLLRRCFGKTPRLMASLSSEVAALGMQIGSCSRVKLLAQLLAMTIYSCSRIAVAALCNWLGKQIATKRLQPIAVVSYITQDETPMVTNIKKADDGVFNNLAPATTKILQSEAFYGFLVFDEDSERYKFLVTELPTNSQAMDSTCGANVRACLEAQMNVPLLQAVATKFKVHVQVSCGDRGSGVIRMERHFMAAQLEVPRLCTLGCRVHCLHTVQGWVLDVFLGAVSGLIATSLTKALSAGVVAMMRTALVTVLVQSATVRSNATPPAADSQIAKYRDSVLDQLLPRDTIVGRRRKVLLQRIAVV